VLLERLQAAVDDGKDVAANSVLPDRTPEVEALKQNRLDLEKDLEQARVRCTELQETLAGQKQELAEQRTEITNELKELRTLIEEQALLFVSRKSRRRPRSSSRALASGQGFPGSSAIVCS